MAPLPATLVPRRPPAPHWRLLAAASLAGVAVAATGPRDAGSAEGDAWAKDFDFVKFASKYSEMASKEAAKKVEVGLDRSAAALTGAKDKVSRAASYASRALSAPAECLSKPASCRTTAELEAWRDHALASIREKAPEAMRPMLERGIDADFEANRARLHGDGGASPAPRMHPSPAAPAAPKPALPACLLAASACATPRELRAWRATKLAWIKDHVPDFLKAQEVERVRKDYEFRLGELEAQAEEDNPSVPGSLAEVATAQAEAPRSTAETLAKAGVLAAFGLSVPALLGLLAGLAKRGGGVMAAPRGDDYDGDGHSMGLMGYAQLEEQS